MRFDGVDRKNQSAENRVGTHMCSRLFILLLPLYSATQKTQNIFNKRATTG